MDHYLILILAEVLDRIVLKGVAIKCRNQELLENFIFQCALKRKGSLMHRGPIWL